MNIEAFRFTALLSRSGRADTSEDAHVAVDCIFFDLGR